MFCGFSPVQVSTSSIRVRSLSSKTWTLESTWTPGVSTVLYCCFCYQESFDAANRLQHQEPCSHLTVYLMCWWRVRNDILQHKSCSVILNLPSLAALVCSRCSDLSLFPPLLSLYSWTERCW